MSARCRQSNDRSELKLKATRVRFSTPDGYRLGMIFERFGSEDAKFAALSDGVIASFAIASGGAKARGGWDIFSGYTRFLAIYEPRHSYSWDGDTDAMTERAQELREVLVALNETGASAYFGELVETVQFAANVALGTLVANPPREGDASAHRESQKESWELALTYLRAVAEPHYGRVEKLSEYLRYFVYEAMTLKTVVDEIKAPTGDDANLPSGTYTMLGLDMVRSTAFAVALGHSYGAFLNRYLQAVRGVLLAEGGREFTGNEGDAFFAAFTSMEQAARAALGVNDALALLDSGTETPVRVRSAIHIGELGYTDRTLWSLAIHKLVRIRAKAEPGQICVSSVAAEILRDRPVRGVTLIALGSRELDDFGVEALWEISAVKSGATA